MHGGSGSTDQEIQEAVSNGVVKMNIDTGKLGLGARARVLG